MIRALALASVGALLFVSCGDDSGGGGSTEAFCDRVAEVDASGDTISLDDPAGLAEFEALVADAPDQIRPQLEMIGSLVGDLDQLDENDPEAFAQAFGLLFDPEFIGAIKDFGVFARDECGIEIEGLEELEGFDPAQIEEELGDLGGQLEEELGDLETDLEQFGEDLQSELESQLEGQPTP